IVIEQRPPTSASCSTERTPSSIVTTTRPSIGPLTELSTGSRASATAALPDPRNSWCPERAPVASVRSIVFHQAALFPPPARWPGEQAASRAIETAPPALAGGPASPITAASAATNRSGGPSRTGHRRFDIETSAAGCRREDDGGVVIVSRVDHR